MRASKAVNARYQKVGGSIPPTGFMKCEFCIEKEEHKKLFVTETEHWRVSLSPNQSYLGYCVVALKRHCGDMADLTTEEWIDFSRLSKRFESAVRKVFGATMFNWSCLMNHAYQAENPQPHVHWHVKPRYLKSVEFCGETFDDNEFGYQYEPKKENYVSNDSVMAILKAVKDNFA